MRIGGDHGKIMSEVFITYQITISEEELDIIEGILEENAFETWTNASIEDAIIKGIFEQILNQAKGIKK